MRSANIARQERDDVREWDSSGPPGFDKDHWPSMADERWAKTLHTYYDTPPYWR